MKEPNMEKVLIVRDTKATMAETTTRSVTNSSLAGNLEIRRESRHVRTLAYLQIPRSSLGSGSLSDLSKVNLQIYLSE